MKRTPIRKVSKKRAKHLRSPEFADALRYMGWVKSLPCHVCKRAGPSDAHHPYHDRYGHRKDSDYLTIPLCKECHQNGPHSVHRDKAGWRERHGPDYEIGAMYRAVYLKNFG